MHKYRDALGSVFFIGVLAGFDVTRSNLAYVEIYLTIAQETF